MLTHSPYEDIPIRRAEDYEAAYARTLDMARRVREPPRRRVFGALGPSPVALPPLRDSTAPPAARDVLKRGLDLAALHIRTGDAVAIGEVGRPHFSIDPEAWRASKEVLHYAMETAKGCAGAGILHTQEPT